MNAKKVTPETLRAQAEAQLADNPELIDRSLSIEELLYELRIHQIELEIQNEELRQMQLALETARDRYYDLYEFAPVAYLTLTEQGLIEEINLTGAAMLGVDRQKLLQQRFARFIDASDSDRWYYFFNQLLKHQRGKSIDLTLKLPDSEKLYAHLDCLQSLNNNCKPTLRIALTDLTERMQVDVKLRIAAIAFEAQEGMIITDADTVILQVNKAFTDMTGYSAEEAVGKKTNLLRSGSESTAFYAAMWQSIEDIGSWQGEIWNKRKNGDIYPEHLSITAVKNESGVVSHYVGTLLDITERKAATQEIERLAFYDPLTNLPNRRLLMDRLKLALISSHRSGHHGALLFIDMDNFKILNDTYGHDTGDVFLKKIADRLILCVRANDTVARLGGDEFIIMLQDLSKDAIEAASQTDAIGKKIISTLNQTYQLNDLVYDSAASIGCALFNSHESGIEELLKQVDIAMYQAKGSGGNGLRFFDPQMQQNLADRVALEADLRLAITQGQFELYYQAQTTHQNEIIGAEVLIRWRHPQRGIILPSEFIPLAEETGLIFPLGLWILEAACRQLKTWESSEHTQHLQLSVNVSARQFHQSNFVELVCQIFRRTAIPIEQLKLELTETLVLDNINDTIHKMHTLRKMGVSFSMDDFGTGYSSLAYLTQLPLAQLKIDRSFVNNIGVKDSDAVIIQTIIGMTENLGIEVIAEGVETESQRAFLEQHGCAFYQGYLCSKPLPIEQFEKSLTIH